MQRSKNSNSATDPGGRIISGEKFSSVTRPLLRNKGAANRPVTPRKRDFPLAKIGERDDLLLILVECSEFQRIFGTIINTVHSSETFCLAHQRRRVRCAFTTHQAQVAVRVTVDDAIDAEDALGRDHTKHRAQGIDVAEKEARFP
jgi:hypothetical protein